MKSLLFIINILIMLFFITSAVAQEVRFASFEGRVVDTCTGKGIQGATIGTTVQGGVSGISSITNKKGKGIAGSTNIDVVPGVIFYAEITKKGKTSRMEYLIEDLEERTYKRKFYLVRRNRCR